MNKQTYQNKKYSVEENKNKMNETSFICKLKSTYVPQFLEKLNKKVSTKVKVYKLILTYKRSLIHFILQLRNA